MSVGLAVTGTLAGVLVPALPASAATSTLDATTCPTYGGAWYGGDCRWYNGDRALVINAGDTVRTTVNVNYGPDGFTNNGTLEMGAGTFTTYWNYTSAGAIIVDSGATFSHQQATFTNNGTVSVASGGRLTVDGLGTTTDFANAGTMTLGPRSTLSITNGATFTNSGTLTADCAATISGTIGGTAPVRTGDCTPPTAAPTQSPAAVSGYNTTDVTVSWNWTDNAGGSGLDPAKCPATTTSTGDGDLTLTGTCTDLAGNTATKTYAVKVDKTAPAAAPTVAPAAGSSGWNNSAVTATWNWTDSGSGLDPAKCPATTTSTGEGDLTLTGTCTDHAGNTGTATASAKVDTTAPSITVTGGPVGGTDYTFGTVPAAPTCSATDSGSGVSAGGCTVTGYGTELGAHTLTFTAIDAVGNTATKTLSYTVIGSAPTLTGTATPTATAGTAYSFAYTVAGTPTPTVALASGSLPAGLSLSADGKITGTPTTSGTATFTVKATNSISVTTSATQTITVAAGAASDVSVNAGTGQAGTATQPFATPLSVVVKDAYGNLVPGASVTFAVTSGSAAFGGSATATATTDAAGIATAPTLTAGRTSGSVTVSATLTGNSSAPAALFTETVLSVTKSRADLKVTVSAPATLAKGATGTVTVTVTNNGPNAAATLVAALDLGHGLIATTSGGGRFGEGKGAVYWTSSGLASGASVTYSVTVKAGTSRELRSTSVIADALSVVPDPNLADNVTKAAIKIT